MPLTLRHPNRLLLGALTLGVCADYFFNERLLGVSVPLFVGLCLALLFYLSRHESHLPHRANMWLAVLAMCFSLALMLRTHPLIVFLDLLVVSGSMLLLVAHYRSAAITKLAPLRVLHETFRALVMISAKPMPLLTQYLHNLPAAPIRRLMPLGRGLLLAMPVVMCFGGLLMSADSVFASYVWDVAQIPFSWSFNLMRWLSHLIMILGVTYLGAGSFIAALAKPDPQATPHLTPSDLPAEGDTQRLTPPRRFLGFTEALTVLLAVDVLFGSFMVIQATYFFGGLETLARTGMSYADYARRGFFELLMVTCLALGLVWSLAYWTQRVPVWKQRAFNGSSTVLILLMLGLLTSAFQRLLLYEEAYGFTRLRLYTHSFMIWLGIILPIFLIGLHLNRFRVFIRGSIAMALIYLALLNIVNLDALIVRENITRYQQNGKLDVYYLSTLSTDAIPALVTTLDKLDGVDQETMNYHLIERFHTLDYLDQTQGWPSWHIARVQALQALRQHYGATPPAQPAATLSNPGRSVTR